MKGRRGGWRWGWHGGWRWRPPVKAPKGYTYIGPCWCGFGPHAFYQDKKGRIVPAWQIYGVPPATVEDLKAELNALKEEKAQLEKMIEEIEKKIKEKGSKTTSQPISQEGKRRGQKA